MWCIGKGKPLNCPNLTFFIPPSDFHCTLYPLCLISNIRKTGVKSFSRNTSVLQFVDLLDLSEYVLCYHVKIKNPNQEDSVALDGSFYFASHSIVLVV